MRTSAAPCLLLVLALVPPATGRDQEPTTHKALTGWVGGVALTPDGKTLALAGSDHKVRLWNVAGKVTATLAGHGNAVCAVAFDPRGKTLASGSHDGTARLWDVAGQKERHTLRGHRGLVLCVAFSPDGATLASGGVDGTIRLWEVATGRERASLKEHRSWVNGLVFLNNSRLASASSDGTVKLWDVKERKAQATFRGKAGEVRCVAVSPDGRAVAAGLRYGLVKVWDAETGKERASFKAHGGETWAVAFAAGGKGLFSGGGDWKQPGEVIEWDAATWKPRRTLRHSGEVLCLAVARDGTIVAGGWDGNVRIWNGAVGQAGRK